MTWKVSYIDLGAQFESKKVEIVNGFERIMKEGSFILREDVNEFEKNMASYLGVKNVIGVNSGTDALYLSVSALGIGEGDEVITVAHSFVATLASIVRVGAKPILVDIRDDFNIDVEQVKDKITDKTKAIIPVHLNGRSCQMKRLEEIADGIPIIEDSAQALGSMYKGKKTGSFGVVGCFSTHPMKILGCAGDGGFISTNEDLLAEKIKRLRDHGQKEKGEFVDWGYNSRLDNLQAAILNVKFKSLKNYISRRREIAFIYSEELKDLPLILPPKPSEGDFFDTYNSYVIRSEQRERLLFHLKKKGIECFVHIGRPLYQYKGLGLTGIKLKNNEKICKEILSIPIYPEMDEKKSDYVIEKIKGFFKK